MSHTRSPDVTNSQYLMVPNSCLQDSHARGERAAEVEVGGHSSSTQSTLLNTTNRIMVHICYVRIAAGSCASEEQSAERSDAVFALELRE